MHDKKIITHVSWLIHLQSEKIPYTAPPATYCQIAIVSSPWKIKVDIFVLLILDRYSPGSLNDMPGSVRKQYCNYLFLKVLITTAVEDILIYFVFEEKIRFENSYESSAKQTIHTKCQVLFSLIIIIIN